MAATLLGTYATSVGTDEITSRTITLTTASTPGKTIFAAAVSSANLTIASPWATLVNDSGNTVYNSWKLTPANNTGISTVTVTQATAYPFAMVIFEDDVATITAPAPGQTTNSGTTWNGKNQTYTSTWRNVLFWCGQAFQVTLNGDISAYSNSITELADTGVSSIFNSAHAQWYSCRVWAGTVDGLSGNITATATTSTTNMTHGWVSVISYTLPPATIAGTTSIPTPTVVTPDATVTPTVVAGTRTIPTPTVTASQDAAVSPAVVAGTRTIGTPTVSTGSGATVTPPVVAGTRTIPTPGVSVGADTTVAPGVVAGTRTIGTPTVSTTSSANPTPAGIVPTPAPGAGSSSGSSAASIPGPLRGPTASRPAAFVERPIRVQVHDMPTLTRSGGHYRNDGDYPVTQTILGVPHVFIQGVDVTFLLGERTLIREWTLVEPGGEDTAAVDFPQIYPFDSVEQGRPGPINFIGGDADLEIVIIEEGATPGVFDGTVHSLWNGIVVSDDNDLNEDSAITGWQAKGLLIGQASVQQHRPVNYMEPTDIGTVIPQTLNAISSRRFTPIPTVTTGIMTRNRGSESDRVWDYVQDLLATAWTDDGQQWTIRRVGPKTYEMVLKDNTTINYEIEAGTPGVTAALTRDTSQKYNVIWGRGVGPDGYSWRGMHYPDFILDIDYNPSDLSVLDGKFRFPLVYDPKVNDGALSPTGIPAVEYNPAVERIDTEFNYPPGISKDQAAADAGKTLARDENPGMAGTLQLRTDLAIPATTPTKANSRFLMPVGSNISYKNFRGGDFSTDYAPFLFRASQVRVHLQTLQVELMVDSRQRDAMTLSQIIERNRDATPDIALRPGNVNRRSRQEPDIAFEFDGEATGGIIPTHTITAGTWKVYPRPLSQVGRIVRIQMHCTNRYALALFGAPVSPTFLAAKVGDPLAVENPYQTNIDDLEAAGLIEGWGRLNDACGYFPGQESTGDPFTGTFVDTNTIEYNSIHPPWVWVCEWVASGTHSIDGRIYPDVNK